MDGQPRSRAPQLHTPTQSFSEIPTSITPDPTSSQGLSVLSAMDKKTFKDEAEAAKARLMDQRFDIREYPDPLLPRDAMSASRFMPQGMTNEMEARLLDVITAVKASRGGLAA